MTLPLAFEAEHLDSPVAALRARIQGQVIEPGDSTYDEARRAWNLSVDQYPAVIVIAANAHDVAEAVLCAKAADLGVAVQSTGHGVILPADAAMLILTSRMTGVEVDAQAQTAWVQAGTLWGAVLEKAQAVGLAPLLGSSPGVGAIGYTLGGGMGWLARKYGLAVDSVLAFEVVTADGQVLRASTDENSDLFWALRGGGGGYAVVTAMRIRLYPVTTVYGGSLIYPVAQAKEVFSFYRDWIQWLPEDWTTSIAVMNFPPIPELPPFLSGQSVVMINGCYAGQVEHGQMMTQPWLDWVTPIANTFKPMPFSDVATISNDPPQPLPGMSSGAWLKDLSDETIDIILRNSIASPLVKTEIRFAGGAIARADASANAFGHRQDTLLMQVVGITPTANVRRAVEHHIAEFKRQLQVHLTGGVYMNFLEGEEARQRTPDAYAAARYDRLKALKAAYDPDNRFRFGFNIPPVKQA